MIITDADTIKSGEMELIDAITGDLDWDSIEQLFIKKHRLGLQEDVEYKKGDIVVHQNQIAYRLEFDVKVTLSVMFDRNGQCLELATSGEASEEKDEVAIAKETDMQSDGSRGAEKSTPAAPITDDESPSAEVKENISQMASQIADMIDEINNA